jgi:hypothetical protein
MKRHLTIIFILLVLILAACTKRSYDCPTREARTWCETQLEGTGITPEVFQAAYDGCDLDARRVYDTDRANNVVASCYANVLDMTTELIYQCMILHDYVAAGMDSRNRTMRVLSCAAQRR